MAHTAVAVAFFAFLGAARGVPQPQTCVSVEGEESCVDSFVQKDSRLSKSEAGGVSEDVHRSLTKQTSGGIELTVYTCNLHLAGTDSDIYARAPGNDWQLLDHWWHNDFTRGGHDKYDLSGSGTNIEIKNDGRDGLCINEIKINGQSALYDLPMWLDSPCQADSYDGVRCKSSAFFTTTATTTPAPHPEQDVLNVLTFNTYLLRVNVVVTIDERSNLNDRQERIATWFADLNDAAVPDIVALQEIYSSEAQDMLRTMCNPDWTKNSGVFEHSHNDYIPCTVDGSKFAYATKCVNPTSSWNPTKTGGVVVLVKKGIEILSSEDVSYEECAGQECFTDLGFWAIKLQKGSQPYWFFGTHAIAYEKPDYITIRHQQFEQMRAYIDANVEDESRLVIAGDMNIFTGPYEDEHGEHHTPTETDSMLTKLGHPGAPATGGDHVPRGFWLPLDSDMSVSADPVLNHVISAIPSEVRLGPQRFDWVIAPGSGDRLATPDAMRYQIVPVKSPTCFVTEEKAYDAGTETDDLSDHYGVFAEIKWTPNAPECHAVTGDRHHGAKDTLPHGRHC